MGTGSSLAAVGSFQFIGLPLSMIGSGRCRRRPTKRFGRDRSTRRRTRRNVFTADTHRSRTGRGTARDERKKMQKNSREPESRRLRGRKRFRVVFFLRFSSRNFSRIFRRPPLSRLAERWWRVRVPRTLRPRRRQLLLSSKSWSAPPRALCCLSGCRRRWRRWRRRRSIPFVGGTADALRFARCVGARRGRHGVATSCPSARGRSTRARRTETPRGDGAKPPAGGGGEGRSPLYSAWFDMCLNFKLNTNPFECQIIFTIFRFWVSEQCYNNVYFNFFFFFYCIFCIEIVISME